MPTQKKNHRDLVDTCEYCGLEGTPEHVQRNGSHHRSVCTRFKDLASCKYCSINGTAEHVQRGGQHHCSDCPLAPELARCRGCDVHSISTLLDEKVSGGIWSEASPEISSYRMIRMEPARLRFCQDSIAKHFRNGASVFGPPLSHGQFKLLACFHTEVDGTRLFALNTRTLFNAIFNNVSTIIVTIVEKPSDWNRRFTGQHPWMCMRVRQHTATLVTLLSGQSDAFVNIPAKNDTLYDLISKKCSGLDIQRFDGTRAYARVRVSQDDAPLVRCVIKAIAKEIGKRANSVDCFEVMDERRYESPRD